MGRESKEIENLKRKFIEVVKVASELRNKFGENILSFEIPERWDEDSTIFETDARGVVVWRHSSAKDCILRSGEMPMGYLEKDIKEIKLMLLKEIQDSYRKRDGEIEDDIERLKVRIKELNASRRSKIGKWIKVKHLIEELQ